MSQPGRAGIRREPGPVRERGYAVDNKERTPGVLCVGAAIRVHQGKPVGAVSISGPVTGMRERGTAALRRSVTVSAQTFSAWLP